MTFDPLPTFQIERTDDGIVLPVQAQPRATRNRVVGLHAGRLKVAVTVAPEKGKANIALEKVLAKALGLKRSQVSLLSGPSSTCKKFLITGLEIEDVRRRIAECLG